MVPSGSCLKVKVGGASVLGYSTYEPMWLRRRTDSRANHVQEKYGIEMDSMTLQRFVLAEQRRYPEATGDLTNLLTSLLTAFKVQFHSQ
ncbi:hypothetical protein Y032_0781g2307 [Ancylostoma ceylanicum]|nr:hypothetical protein Y032_0781g2307 [Ancylostoma ceylanicum]